MSNCCGAGVVETRAVQEPFLENGNVLTYLWLTCEACGKDELVSIEPRPMQMEESPRDG